MNSGVCCEDGPCCPDRGALARLLTPEIIGPTPEQPVPAGFLQGDGQSCCAACGASMAFSEPTRCKGGQSE